MKAVVPGIASFMIVQNGMLTRFHSTSNVIIISQHITASS